MMDTGILERESSEVVFPAKQGLWFVLHTKSRQEKVVAQDLESMGVMYFLPLVSQVRFYGNRKARVRIPIFPGYVFLKGELEDTYRIDRTKRLAGILKVNDQKKLEWELRNLHLAIAREASLEMYPYLKNGVKVEVRSGPFRGLQGVIEGKTPKNRLMLQVDILGQGVSLELDGSLLDVLE
jgi:transcription termination/antitermination protein NusG